MINDYFFWKLEKMISQNIQNWLDVIEKMNNDNTYKLAWGRSILEYLGNVDVFDDVEISFDELSKLIIKYYWNQLYFFNLTQGSNKNKLPVIEQIVRRMIEVYKKETGELTPVWYERAEKYFKSNKPEYERIIKEISNALNKDVCWRFMNIGKVKVPLYVLNQKDKTINILKNDALELKEYRFVLSQLFNYRWAQLLEQYNSAPCIAKKVKGLSDNKVRRNNLTKFKNILLDTFHNHPIDFYTGDLLDDNDITVDHVIPWSFMYSDDIWNLVLTSKSNNSSKSNSVPTDEDIDRLKKRNSELLNKINDEGMRIELIEAINNNYVDKFYNSMKL